MQSIEDDYANYKECISEDTEIADEEEYKLVLRHPDTQRAFCGYEYTDGKEWIEGNKLKLKKKNEKREIEKYLHVHTMREKNKF